VTQNTPTKTFKRRWRLIIYPKFQFTLVALNAGLITVMFGVFLFYQSRSYATLIQMGEQAHLGPNHPYFQLLQYQTGNLRLNMSVAYVSSLLLGSFLTLVISQKLAGPIVRMKSFFTRIGNEGVVKEKLSFRKGDFFIELPVEVNRALERLSPKQ
jgi:hypothetical protein